MTDEAGDSLVKGLFRRGARRVNLSGYYEGDVVERRPTHIAKGSTVAGNVRAPEVHVDGLVVGAVVTKDLKVSASGCIVGDVFTGCLALEAGGQLQGWVFELTPDEFERLQARGAGDEFELPQAAEGTGFQPIPPELHEALGGGEKALDRQAILKQVQAVVGDALLARANLEQQFDVRVEATAGDMAARLRNLEEAFAAAQAELDVEATARAALEAELATSHAQNARQRKELDGVRDLLQKRVEALRKREEELARLRIRAEHLDGDNLSLQRELSSALEPMERLKGRVESLENALQASVLRNAEQEQAQLHWQELADLSQQRVKELESQLAVSAEQLDRLATAHDELNERLASAEQERAATITALDELRAAQATGTKRNQEQQRLDDALARSERLDAQLDAARAEITALEEQLAWNRLSVTAAEARLRIGVSELRTTQSDLRRQLEDAALQLAAQRENENDLQARVNRLTELLYEADRRAKQRDSEFEALRSAAAHHIQKLRVELADKDSQLRGLKSA